ncbi:GNAT family N-acetyltransferase [Sphingobacterium thalpophilum]|uniref:GNAT family N-acetyltransferase n=1 Tax=Sphingobacterium thalpophilum TaxID=259 RepID=UPI0037DA4C17
MNNASFRLALRPTTVEDLETLFTFQLDKESNYLAAFTSADPADKAAYLAKYSRLLNEPSVNNQTILIDGTIAGSIAKFVMEGDHEITYWIDRRFWGRGIATQALCTLLALETVRPIFGRVAFDNRASQKVLEHCGFVKIGNDKGYANARQSEIEEYIYRLDT